MTSTFQALYDGHRRGKDMLLILPMSQWGGRAYGLGQDHDYRLHGGRPEVGREVTVTVDDNTYRRLTALHAKRMSGRRPARRWNSEKKQEPLFSVEEEGFALTHPKGSYERVQVPRGTQHPLFEPEKPDREKMEELREQELAERAERRRKRKKAPRKKNKDHIPPLTRRVEPMARDNRAHGRLKRKLMCGP